MTGVDPRIPVKPHPGSQYRVKRAGESDRDGGRGGGREMGGGEETSVLVPLNSCKLITINQALFFERTMFG